LNLGYEKWLESGYPFSNTATFAKPIQFVAAIKPEYLTTTLQMQLTVDNPNHILIDTRPEKEYLGLNSKTDTLGHIPGAINIPYSLNLNTDEQMIRPMTELSLIYGQHDKKKTITVYCSYGIQSSLNYFVLRNLGYKVSAYDGGWFEWSNNSDLPVANPNSPTEQHADTFK